jgi:hypothetical protein
MKCPTVTIIDGIPQSKEICFKEQQFFLHLHSSNASSTTPVLLFPYNLQDNLEPTIITNCLHSELVE